MAEGVMILLLGKTTKLNFVFENDDKCYGVEATLGYTSESYDNQEEMTKIKYDKLPTENEVKKSLLKFRGNITQVPPAYSAVKIDGKPAYYWKRKKGIDVKIKSREVEVKNRFYSLNNDKIEFLSTVSKGTYIRSLINDIGQDLGCGAVMSKLIRYRAGQIKYSDCAKLNEDYMLSAIKNEDFFNKYEKYTTNFYSIEDISRGNTIEKKNLIYQNGVESLGGFPLFIDNIMVAFIEFDGSAVKYKRVLV